MDVKTETRQSVTKELATEGYIYCFTNLRSQPGLCKVGMTERTPTERLSEANSRDTWRSRVCIYGHKQSITPYQIEFAKKVSNPKQKEQTLHKLLTHHTDPLDSIVSGHPGGILPKHFPGSKIPTENFYRELFRISPQEVSAFFELCDGELWDENAYCPTVVKNRKMQTGYQCKNCGSRRKRLQNGRWASYCGRCAIRFDVALAWKRVSKRLIRL